ncbi:MAG: amidohydrolase [Acidimicrobiales bacterium]|jgi:predicted TIM-barrel fold metal-dependent hydrolase|nr:amidohydrolase [Acidimicrobiales bacterium]HAA67091.1 amidohydrolase [Acidimicrobiaceae bacterium]|tara:strand:- start:512 stop:1678 length:1167 start_codon:yes stop_codon:yes gene_type:complete
MLYNNLKVIDTDSHWSEPYDLWTSRAPAKWKDRVPQMEERDGKRRWWFDGNIPIGLPIASSVIGQDGTKVTGTAFFDMDNDVVHRASFDPDARVSMLDSLGIHAQIMYPNVAGFGNQNFLKSSDEALRLISVEIYNDALAEFQADTGERVFGMALLPWWNLDAAVKEIERAHANGLRGIVTCANPEEAGLPDMGTSDWDPIWATCSELNMPVNFHIGSSKGNMDFFGRAPWPSFGEERKLAVGSANLFMGNARTVGNLIYSGIPERFPNLKFVSVESGVGWLPFFLEILDHQMTETAPNELADLSMSPSDYFRRQFFGCFWFERSTIKPAVDFLGSQCLLFETDFPHPTCLYPRDDVSLMTALDGLDESDIRAILQDNAAKLYRIDIE